MKILTTRQVREADAYTIQNEPISSVDLMERASRAFVEAYLNLPVGQSAVTVICGPGNNGGDGLAVARLLTERNIKVEVWLVNPGGRLSTDCALNLKRWRSMGPLVEITSVDQLQNLKPEATVIDAIFGSGISRGIEGLVAEVVKIINDTTCLVVAVDMPSGLFAEQANPKGEVVKADYTLSFQVPKLGFFLPQNDQFVGTWKILDIGLNQTYLGSIDTILCAIDARFLQEFKKKPSRFAHKGVFGHALLVAGSKGKMGAAILAARAALRGGTGLLTLHVPQCGYVPVQTAVPEAMCQVDRNEEVCTHVELSQKTTVVAVGPGLGLSQDTKLAFKTLLEGISKPMVIDADGLNILSQHSEFLGLIPANSILTPHPKEFERLAGKMTDDYHRLEVQAEFAINYQVILVYKGANTTIALPDGRLFFNTSGNPGMATAGSGDVLTGFITGLLSRTDDPILAAVAGVYLHGLAADLAVMDISPTSLIAGDIIDYLGPAIQKCNLLL